MSLAAIATQFRNDPDVVEITLGSLPGENPALAAWESMRRRDTTFRESTPLPSPPAHTYFMRSAGATSGRGVKLREFLLRLGVKGGYPKVSSTVRIDVTSWCTVLIDERKLRKLSRSETNDLVGAISASLLKARASK